MLSPTATNANPSLLILEFGFTAIAIALAFAWPRFGSSFFARIESASGKLARRKGLAATCVGLSVLLARLAIVPLYPVPLPFCPDDFSFQLASDTFALGRLTNPTPAMWAHFESIHITMKPTYMSMYFPGQGLIMAAGKVLLGSPWLVILIVSALMCAALCWMLQAWLPPSWALLGGVVAALRLGIFSYWTNTYHAAGSLAALGGALILGSLPRIKRKPNFRYWLLMGIGIAIVGLTRPFEGTLLCIPVLVALIHWLRTSPTRPSAAVLVRRTVAPMAVVIATGAWLAYYDYRAFGSPTTLPYTVDRNTYAIAPYYVWQPSRPEPAYRHPMMRKFYDEGELKYYTSIHSVTGFVPETTEKIGFFFLFYSGFALAPPLLMMRRIFLDRRIRFLVICVVILAAGMLIEIFLLPHYVAPFTGAFYAIGLQAMRHLRLWKPESKPVGLTLARMTIAICVVMAGIRLFAQPLHLAAAEWPASNWNFTWFGPEHFGIARAQIEAKLAKLPGQQLVIVRYNPDHNPFDEWVYNAPDIDSSKVVWAREMGPEDNRELIQYYAHRKVWLVEPDAVPARISPYPVSDPSEVAAH
jgi:hypothetical protein